MKSDYSVFEGFADAREEDPYQQTVERVACEQPLSALHAKFGFEATQHH